jgi:hypothetical protein
MRRLSVAMLSATNSADLQQHKHTLDVWRSNARMRATNRTYWRLKVALPSATNDPRN